MYDHNEIIIANNEAVVNFCLAKNIEMYRIAYLTIRFKLIGVVATNIGELATDITNNNDDIEGKVVEIYTVPGNGRIYQNAIFTCTCAMASVIEGRGKLKGQNYIMRAADHPLLSRCKKCRKSHSTRLCRSQTACRNCSSLQEHDIQSCQPHCSECFKMGYAYNHRYRSHRCRQFRNELEKTKQSVFM